jgi:hypothetical protein
LLTASAKACSFSLLMILLIDLLLTSPTLLRRWGPDYCGEKRPAT